MRIKRFTLVFMLLVLLTAGVSAGDDPGPRGYAVAGYWHSGPSVLLADPIIQEATGLEGEGLRAALLDGQTLSELIEANGGDVEGVRAALLAQAAKSIQANAAAAIDGLEAGFNETMDESHRRRFPWWRRRNPVRDTFGVWGMDETIMQATGLAALELNRALLEGSTIAGLIEANEGDVPTTVSTLVEQATNGINEAAAARIARYEDALTEAFEADLSDRSRRWRHWRPGHGAFFSFRGVYDGSQPDAGVQPETEDVALQTPGEPDDA